MSRFGKGSALVAVVTLAALITAVSAFARTDAPTPVTVTAGKPTEFAFTLSKKTVKKGTTALTVAFKVTNKGTVSHDFKIAGKKTLALKAGKTATLKVIFKKKGRYAYLCTLPGHAAGGMKGTFTVK